MKKLIAWCKYWWLSIAALGLLAFIPLYPKLPLFDIRNTWVYVRLEDFVVLFVLLGWVASNVCEKRTLKTPLTAPILLFWLIGAIATLHSILLIVPTVWEIFPNVAFLSYLRRIEYMSLFFVAYAAVRDKRYFLYLSFTVVLSVLAVSLYGIGQKFAGFPAFLTMNEEFAKGIPIQLSALSRISSTFGGHYDLAAYLVLMLSIVFSLLFAIRNWVIKGLLGLITMLGFWVLFMTVSRISVFALFVSFGVVLFVQRRKLVLLTLPIAAIGILLLISFAPSLLDRFGSTVKQVDVLVRAKTGDPVGHIQIVPNSYFKEKVVRQLFYDSIGDVTSQASHSAEFIIPYGDLPQEVILLTEPTAPTGEDLPSGTGYINLTLSPDIRRLGAFMYEPKTSVATTSANVFIINGEYVMKRAYAYDLSFTTRFQGEWPKAIAAFKRNVLFGSGYGSVSLAVDNSYLRMLGEVGTLGFVAFLSIFLMMALYVKKALASIDSREVKSFVWGFAAGLVGLAINALFIDVFEASKVAFVLWLLTGSVIGMLSLYQRTTIRFYPEMKRIVTSGVAVVLYLAIAVLLLWSPLTKNYFIGDDFTWFRWAASCENTPSVSEHCAPAFATIAGYFTNAQGFFYRPGAKLYFASMYWLFWLNQTAYHFVSLFLHFVVSVLVFVLGSKLFKKKVFGALSAFLFVSLSGFSEAVFWISASGFLFAATFMLLSVLLYGQWREKNTTGYLIGTIASFVFALFFHELGTVTPLLFVLYEWTMAEETISWRSVAKRISVWLLVLPLPLYAVARLFARSHWCSGDYSFNIAKLPLNAAGNAFGYVLLALAGTAGTPLYQIARMVLKEHLLLTFGVMVVIVAFGIRIGRVVWQRLDRHDRKILLFAAVFSVVSLLPFLGLGNIASRYGYLASVGITFLLVFCIGKLHAYLTRSGHDIAMIGAAVIVGVFVMFHSVSLHQVHKDWSEAGEIVKRFFVGVDSSYHDYWTTSPMEFHFVNVPIRHREAWVFPVGISDALWFVFHNPDIRVYTWSSVTSAFDAVTYGSTTQKVFVFDAEGKVREVKKSRPDVQ